MSEIHQIALWAEKNNISKTFAGPGRSSELYFFGSRSDHHAATHQPDRQRGPDRRFQRRFLGRTMPVVLVHRSHRKSLWCLQRFPDLVFDSERYI